MKVITGKYIGIHKKPSPNNLRSEATGSQAGQERFLAEDKLSQKKPGSLRH